MKGLIRIGSIFVAVMVMSSGSQGQTPATEAQVAAAETFQPSEDVAAILKPLFDSIRTADRSRATVQLFTEKVQDGQIIQTDAATYQIASAAPDRYTLYYKTLAANSTDPVQRTRLYSDGKRSLVALAPDAFVPLSEKKNCQELVTDLPVEMGPYPELLLALTLAGVDPAFSLLTGVQTVDVIERKPFRGRVDSVRLRGLQNDGVVWDLWVSDEASPQPLRLIVDLTPVLIATKKVSVPDGYAYSLRYDFVSWRVTGDIDESLFQFEPASDARQFDSVAAYQAFLLQAGRESKSLLNESAPEFKLRMLDGSTLETSQLQGKTVVLDFWSTTCGPCIDLMPTLIDTTQKFADKKVVLIAINIGESASRVKGFLSVMDWKVTVAIDPDQVLAQSFQIRSIPQTILISPSGKVAAVYAGQTDPSALARSLASDITGLVRDGQIPAAKAPQGVGAGPR